MYRPSQRGSVAVECGLQILLFGQREQRLRQTAEIPETDKGLLIKGIAAVVVGVVTDETRVVVVHEPKRTVVEGDAMDRHIVRVHNPMSPADGLPLPNQLRGALDDLGEESHVLVRTIHKVGKVVRDDIVGEDFELLVLFTVIKDLKGAKAHMGRRHPHEHRADFDLLAIDLVVAADDAERPSRRNAKPMHGFAAEILPDGRTQNRTAISLSRERRKPRTFQMQIPLLSPFVPHLSKQDGAPVSQLRHIDPELMAGVEHRQGLHPWDEHAPAEDAGKLRSLRLLQIKIDQFGRRGIEAHEMRRLGKRRRIQLRIEGLGQDGQ